MAEQGYIGRSPGDSSVIVARQTFTPSGVTTDFTFSSGYDPGYMDCYLNGIRLIVASDYTATNGSTVGLTSFANSGDVVELVAYKAFNLASVTDAGGDFTVGNKLTVSGISSLTDVVSSGIVTADSFSGNLGPGAVTSSGALTINDTTASSSTTTGSLIVKGGVGIAKSLFIGEGLSVGGTITYDDVTNIDSVGIVTAGKGLRVTTGGAVISAGNVKVNAGIVTVGAGLTLSSDFIHLTDNAKINLGIASDLKIYHDSNNSIISNGTGELLIDGDTLSLRAESAAELYLYAVKDAGVNLYWNNSKKVETTSPGILVTGICSATEFSGDGSQLSGVGGDTDITSCLFI